MTTITLPRATVEQALSLCESVHGLRTDDEDGSTVWCQELIDALREALAEPVQEPDLNHCPQCGGPADNGHDRCFPPNPYFCTKCMEKLEKNT